MAADDMASPSSEKFRVERRDAEGGVAVIAIAGRLTLAQGNELRASIRRSAWRCPLVTSSK